MVQTVRKNFKRKYRDKSLKCPSCKPFYGDSDEDVLPDDSQSHLSLECPAFSDLREQLDSSDEGSLADFFRQVISRRLNQEEDQDQENSSIIW